MLFLLSWHLPSFLVCSIYNLTIDEILHLSPSKTTILTATALLQLVRGCNLRLLRTKRGARSQPVVSKAEHKSWQQLVDSLIVTTLGSSWGENKAAVWGGRSFVSFMCLWISMRAGAQGPVTAPAGHILGGDRFTLGGTQILFRLP